MRFPLVMLVALAAPAAAQSATQAAEAPCPARTPLPSDLSGWDDQTPVSAGTRPGDGATIAVGKAARVSLVAGKHLALSPAPAKGDGAGSGGTLSLPITKAGTYRVALSGGAWIDLVQAGKSVDSTSHGHGPRCTGVRKMVDFALVPGNYVIQLSGSDSDTIGLMVAAL